MELLPKTFVNVNLDWMQDMFIVGKVLCVFLQSKACYLIVMIPAQCETGVNRSPGKFFFSSSATK